MHHHSANVSYRHIKNLEEKMWGEYLGCYMTYHPKLKEPVEGFIATVEKDGIYKLVNAWNRTNRLQKSEYYYEAVY